MKQVYIFLILALAASPMMAQVTVTFSVDMTVTSADTAGVFVTGSWMDDAGLGGEWQEPGSNMDAQLSDPDGNGVYTLTVTMAAGDYAYKYANGSGWPNAEAGGGADNYQADLSGCDGVDNGFGGYNRSITVPDQDSFVLTTYQFNSCTESAVTSIEDVSTVNGLMIAPNPADGLVNISFTNEKNAAHLVRLVTLTGQVMTQVELGQSRNLTLDVANYPAGLYLLQVTNGLGETGSRKLMIR